MDAKYANGAARKLRVVRWIAEHPGRDGVAVKAECGDARTVSLRDMERDGLIAFTSAGWVAL